MKKLKFISGTKYKHWLWLLFFLMIAFQNNAQIVGAEQSELYLPKMKGKKIGLVVNQTSMSKQEHLVDFLLKMNVNIVCIFAPEHGFRGDHAAGSDVKSGIDLKTKLPLISLYGNNRKPTEAQLKNLDLLVFDIQDVGVRFYTYLSTLHYLMEACAEQKKPLLILDRPNPNGHYVDGNILDTAFRSFVGMHPVPIVHGCTVAEYALMINGEGWLKNGVKCDLQIIKVKNYTHKSMYKLPVKPSPNLPNMSSIYLYPSICLFEGTPYSIGRGTNKPFELIGKPACAIGTDTFTPQNLPGIAEHPPCEGKLCRGFYLGNYGKNIAPFQKTINLFWLIEMYKNDAEKEKFFTPFFNTLAGGEILKNQIIEGKSEEEIHNSWQSSLKQYKIMRRKYLLYADFEP